MAQVKSYDMEKAVVALPATDEVLREAGKKADHTFAAKSHARTFDVVHLLDLKVIEDDSSVRANLRKGVLQTLRYQGFPLTDAPKAEVQLSTAVLGVGDKLAVTLMACTDSLPHSVWRGSWTRRRRSWPRSRASTTLLRLPRRLRRGNSRCDEQKQPAANTRRRMKKMKQRVICRAPGCGSGWGSAESKSCLSGIEGG